MKYRAVFCDIDGTLLDTAYTLRPATAEAVRLLHAAGTPFIPVSARSPVGIHPIRKALGITGAFVAYGGALVVDREGNNVHSIGMEMERVVSILEFIKKARPAVVSTVYAFDDWLVEDAGDPWIALEADLTAVPPTEMNLSSIRTFRPEAHKVFCMGSPEDILYIENSLAQANPDLAVIKSTPHFLEIMDGRVTKANAMRYLCQAMRLPLQDVVAFGDNYNDIDMLEAAGLGVAMGNAPDEVKARADMVTTDNDHEGVKAALEQLEFALLANSVRFERARFLG